MKYKYQISASISTTTLRKIGKDARKGDKTHLITIDTNDRDHFASVIFKSKGEL